jgi:3-oxoacyl-[acyl-carrier protein] reductase
MSPNPLPNAPDDPPVVLVTGARRGIGAYLARHLHGRGFCVVGCALHPHEPALPGMTYHAVDIRDEVAVRRLFAEIGRTPGRLDAVVNAAGLGPIMNHALLTPASTIERFLEHNVVGTFLVCREAAKLMRRRNKRGRIVNFSSISVPLRLEGEAGYIASKAGVERLSQVLAREFAEFGITVNVVGPTPIATDALEDVPPEKIDALVGGLPVARWGRFEDVANVVDFFLDPRSDAITGQVLYLGGVTNG